MRHRLLPCLFVALLTVTTAPGLVFAQDAGLDAGVDAGLDAGDSMDAGPTADASVDAGPTADAGPIADAGADVGVDLGVDGGVVDPDGGVEAGDALRFSGKVTLQGRDSFAGVEVVLSDDGGASFRGVSEADGRFAVEEVPPGSYQIELSFPGYVTITDTVELDRSRRGDFSLFLDEYVPVALTIEFGGEIALPEAVTVVFRSDREIFDVELDAPQQGRQLLEIFEGDAAIGVGSWQITAEAEGFREVSYALQLPPGASSREAPVGVTLRLPVPTEAEVLRESGCGVAPGGARDGGLLVLLGLAGVMVLRRRRRAE